MAGQVRVGTCSWTDPTMVRAWYPPAVRTAADRLRYYATQFDTVEVDSTVLRSADLRHRPTLGRADAARVRVSHQGVRHAHAARGAARAAAAAVAVGPRPRGRPPGPHRPPVARTAPRGLRLLQRRARAAAGRGQAGPGADAVSAVLRGQRGQPGVHSLLAPACSPPTGWRWSSGTPPGWSRKRSTTTLGPARLAWARRTCASTSRRLAGAQRAAAARGRDCRPGLRAASTAATPPPGTPGWSRRPKRFEYLYSDEELAEWVEPVRHLQEQTATTYVMFNNCFADYAPRNAQQMMSLFDAAPATARQAALRRPSKEAGGAPAGRRPEDLHS